MERFGQGLEKVQAATELLLFHAPHLKLDPTNRLSTPPPPTLSSTHSHTHSEPFQDLRLSAVAVRTLEPCTF